LPNNGGTIQESYEPEGYRSDFPVYDDSTDIPPNCSNANSMESMSANGDQSVKEVKLIKFNLKRPFAEDS